MGRRRRRLAVLSLVGCLAIGGCAQRDTSSEQQRQDGFYGGVSAGKGL
jgi:hypothetical protein